MYFMQQVACQVQAMTKEERSEGKAPRFDGSKVCFERRQKQNSGNGKRFVKARYWGNRGGIKREDNGGKPEAGKGASQGTIGLGCQWCLCVQCIPPCSNLEFIACTWRATCCKKSSGSRDGA